MRPTEYHITDLDLSLSEISPGQTRPARTEFGISHSSNPQYETDIGAFVTPFELEVRLYESNVAETRIEESGEPTGVIQCQFLTIVEGDESEFESAIERWREHGYDAVSADFRSHLEEGITDEIIVPIAGLLRPSYRGLVPRLLASDDLDESLVSDGRE
ncbi:hypothetical protein [Halorussus aquaticus]|uniref:Uncharacterized protein n=1 Tax=Halorussus aquaticus TaxID=2953748 RepID=A0ABD5Q147_9EURY|nr:hypothetical protein [Halorussus aquaticus]